MRTFLATVLGIIAAGILMIAYGLLSPRAIAAPYAADSRTDSYAYPLARPVAVSDRSVVGDSGAVADTPQLQLRCEPGQRAVVRQIGGAAVGECVSSAYTTGYVGATPASLTYPASDVRTVRYQPVRYQTVAPRRTTSSVRVDKPHRDWAKTALVIGGSTAAGAGLGGIFGGKKGALIGAAIGGGASTLFEATRK